MHRKYKTVIVLLMAVLTLGCNNKNDSLVEKNNSDFKEYKVKFYKEHLDDEFYDGGYNYFFVNEKVFSEDFFELQKNWDILTNSEAIKLDYIIERSEFYEIVFPENKIMGQWTIDDKIESEELVYTIPSDIREEFKIGPISKSTTNHQFVIKDAKAINEIRFKLLRYDEININKSFEDAKASIEITFKIK